MKRFVKSLIVFSLIFVFAFPVNAFAETSSDNVVNITVKQMNSNAGKYMENALKNAKGKGTKENPVVINIPSGTYSLKTPLHIFSNTVLHLEEDTELVKNFEDSNMIKLGVKEEVNTGYSGYYNIVIEGGTWNCNYTGDSCIMRFAHCNNITLRNTTLKNQMDAHHMELAGANNFKIVNCTFTGYKKTSGGDGEAIQIDPIHNTTHFPAYEKYDDTPCKNILVKNCTFKDIFAGVGTRSGVIGSYFTNVQIVNNKFYNIKDKAICAFNYRNSKIENNEINNASIGIIFEYFPASNLLGKLYMPNSSKASTKILTNTKCYIRNNKITVLNQNNRGNSSGVAVYGGRIDKEYSQKVNLKAGNYIVSGLNISNNSIVSKSKSSDGIILEYVNKSNIKKNNIKSSTKSLSSGIVLNQSKKNNILNNTITSFANGASSVEKSKANYFKKNKFLSNNNYAVSVSKGSTAVIYFGNQLKGNKGKYEISEKAFPLYGAQTKLKAKKTAKKNTLVWSKSKGVTGYRIYRSTKKNGNYKMIKAVSAKKNTKFTDTKIKKNKKYYYKIVPYINAAGSRIYGRTSNVA